MDIDKKIKQIPKTNPFGEQITIVAATKTRTVDEINLAADLGIKHIGENTVQEFNKKYDMIKGVKWHFIGHLQTNKVKYLIGKTYLIQSLDRDKLAKEIDFQSKKSGVVTDVLMQINIGSQLTKGGYLVSEAKDALISLKKYENINILGLMAMLPYTTDTKLLQDLSRQMRTLYDDLKAVYPIFCYLSLGMSGDYKTAIECGSNMVRLGSCLFEKN